MFAAVFLGAFGLDFITKLLVSSRMSLGQEIVLIKGLLSLNYVVNYGAAYNLFENNGWLLIPVTAAMIGLLLWYYLKHRSEFSRAEVCSFAMILGGGAGNLLSRLSPGYVVDFIDIRILPVFNVADIFICCGCALLLYCEFFLAPSGKDAE